MTTSDTKEVEVKVKVTDFEKIQETLVGLGCKLSDPLSQDDIIYLPKGTKFTNITTNTNVLRLRNQNGKKVFTLKRNSETSLAKIERETEIENIEQMKDILDYLDYYQVADVKK